MNIADSQIQMTLDLDSALTQRYRSVKEVCAAGIYRRGLVRMAGELNEAPGNLSVQLSDDGQRKFDVDAMELYIQKTGDKSPIYFLVAKYCGDQSAERDDAIEQIQSVLAGLPTLLANAGLNARRPKKTSVGSRG